MRKFLLSPFSWKNTNTAEKKIRSNTYFSIQYKERKINNEIRFRPGDYTGELFIFVHCGTIFMLKLIQTILILRSYSILPSMHCIAKIFVNGTLVAKLDFILGINGKV